MPTSAPKTSASPRRSATSPTATVVPADSASASAGIPTLRRVAEPRYAAFGANIDPAIRASTLRGVIRVVTTSVLFIHPGTSVRRPAFAASIACVTTASAVMYVDSGTFSLTPATSWNSVWVAPGQSASTPPQVLGDHMTARAARALDLGAERFEAIRASRHQHDALACARELPREFRPEPARCASNQCNVFRHRILRGCETFRPSSPQGTYC